MAKEHNQCLVDAFLKEGFPGNKCANAITNRMIREQQQTDQGTAESHPAKEQPQARHDGNSN